LKKEKEARDKTIADKDAADRKQLKTDAETAAKAVKDLRTDT
jgi:hypothetical protein